VKKIGLSFGDEDEETEQNAQTSEQSAKPKARPGAGLSTATTQDDEDSTSEPATIVKKRFKPSSSVAVQAKAQTKSALAKEALLKETLKKQYLATNEAVRSTEFVLPFVFFEAKDMAGGKVRLKKGDFVWLFLERARKVGIELGERGDGPMGLGGRRREWARIGVDDLMLVVGEMMIPHVSVYCFCVEARSPFHVQRANDSIYSTSTSTPSSSTNSPAITASSSPSSRNRLQRRLHTSSQQPMALCHHHPSPKVASLPLTSSKINLPHSPTPNWKASTATRLC
jgi:protein FAM50